MSDSTQSSHVDHVTIADIIERRREHYQIGEELLAQFQAGEITEPEYEARLTAHGGDLPRFPAGYQIGPCPPWCTVDHSTESRFTLSEGVREHSYTVATVGDISVDVAATDNLDEGTRSPAAVMVMGADNTLDAGTARWLADALVKAADLLDGHWSPAVEDAEADLDEVAGRLAECRRVCGGEPAAVLRHQEACSYGCSRCRRPVPCRDHGWSDR